jgi:opacity protein-like surface antigen
MKQKAIVITAAVAALAAAALAGTQAVALKRVVKAGDKAAYGMKIKLDYQGTPVDVTFDTLQTITKVNDDGSYVATEENKNMVIMVGGQETAGAGEDETTTTTYAKDGSILKIEASVSTGDEYRLANLSTTLWPTKPVDVKSKWEGSVKGDSAKGTFDVVHSYEILAREQLMGYDTFKVAFNSKESGAGTASASGIVWLDVKTGLPVEVEGEMKSVPIQGVPMDATFALTLKKP